MELRVDDWGIDIALTSSQKAFALPPGIAFAAVSDRLLERAKSVPHRGYYFDFLTLETSLLKNNTPSTPPVALMFAADMQMDQILAEGVEGALATPSRVAPMPPIVGRSSVVLVCSPRTAIAAIPLPP